MIGIVDRREKGWEEMGEGGGGEKERGRTSAVSHDINGNKEGVWRRTRRTTLRTLHGIGHHMITFSYGTREHSLLIWIP